MGEEIWYWAEADQQNGPVQLSAIARLVADGKLGAEDLVWKEGMAQWIAVGKVPALAKYIKTAASAGSVAAIGTPMAAVAVEPVPAQMLENAPRFPGPLACPHCSSGNTADAQFCEACGMAMPIASSGPRIVDSTNFASTAAGQQLQSDELHKLTKKASGALLAVSIIQTVVVVILLAVANANNRIPQVMQNPLALGLVVIAGLFWGLYIWSRQQPLPAAIVGLVLYVTMVGINVVTSISQAGNQGTPQIGRGIGGSGIGWLDIVIIAVLIQAISAGLKYRKMQGNPLGTT